jgi:hypothetical protein
MLHLGLYCDNLELPEYLELVLGVAGDSHELDITRSCQDDVVRPGKVKHLKREHLIVACVSKGDQQSDPPEGDVLLTQDHVVEWMWAALELVTGKPQPLKCVKVHEVEATTPIHEGFGEPGHPD